MFKHKIPVDSVTEAAKEAPQTIMAKSDQPTIIFETPVKDVSPAALRDLMEKNLKWSQILYEQNRKINRKLFWYSFASWIRTIFIVIPILLALWFLPAAYQQVKIQYAPLFNKLGAAQSVSRTTNLEEILKVLPLSDVERERLKNILK